MKLFFYLILATVSFVKGEKCFAPMICNNIPTWARISMNREDEVCGNQIKQLEEKADRMTNAINEMVDKLENIENTKSTTMPVTMYKARGTLADSFETDDRDNVKLTTQVVYTSTTKPATVHGVETTDDVTTSGSGTTNDVTHGIETTNNVTTLELGTTNDVTHVMETTNDVTTPGLTTSVATTTVVEKATTKPTNTNGMETTDDVTTPGMETTDDVTTPGMETTDDVTTPGLTTSVATTPELTTNPNHNDCSTIDKNDAPLQKSATGGVFTINPGGTGQLGVYCDLTTDGGKWTVFQRRQDGRVDFVSPNWADYVNGFGDPANEYWLGLEKLHQMTANGKFELRIDLEDWDGNKRYAEYKNFHIGSAATKYQLNIGSYQGDAGDSLTLHNGMKFTTFDQDNDAHSARNCASRFNSGGWWWQSCFNSALNGKYNNQGPISTYGEGIIWRYWRGFYYSLKSTEMKFRPMV